jgi:AcrR family transcriptional regulator
MLDAATAAFARAGFHEVSMEEIAAAVGVTKPMIYAYFGSKEGLFVACVRKTAVGLRQRVREQFASHAREDEAFYRALLAVFDFVEENREGWKILHPEGGPPPGPIGGAAAEVSEAMVELLMDVFRQTAAARGMSDAVLGDPEDLARALNAATIAAVTHWVRNGKQPKELAALRLMNVFWMGYGDLFEGRLWLPGAGES